jgi:hypothetical protein
MMSRKVSIESNSFSWKYDLRSIQISIPKNLLTVLALAQANGVLLFLITHSEKQGLSKSYIFKVFQTAVLVVDVVLDLVWARADEEL